MKLLEPSVELIWITEDAEKLVEIAGRTAWRSENKICPSSYKDFLARIIGQEKHYSIMEHVSASFRIICNRYTSHQLVRHRHFSFTQESQRYCNYSKDKFDNSIQFVMPMNIKQSTPRDIESVETYLKQAESNYMALLSSGCTPEVARSVLPSAVKTELVMTGNFRCWKEFLEKRLSYHAQSDIRFLAYKIDDILNKKAPCIFG